MGYGKGESTRAGSAAGIGLLAVILWLLAAPASSAAAPPTIPLPDCATPIAPSGLSAGQPAVGYTVRRGETVETFDVEILGVLEDGIAPGRDMIVVDASGPVIDEGGGGIAAGMSGSPVYTLDGRLIGAIAYSLSVGPGSTAGVTPAGDVLDTLAGPTRAPGPSSGEVELDRATRARIASEHGIRTSAVGRRMSRLDLPLSVSGGLGASRLAMLGDAIQRRELPFVVTPGTRASAVPSGSAGLAPGDSLIAALSYGDVTLAATGTATYVCGGRLAGFGHPFLFEGPTLLGASRGRVIRVVADPLLGPFKLAQAGEAVGVIDRDRLAAVGGRLGAAIPTIPIVQETRAPDSGRERKGARTEAVRGRGAARMLLPELAFMHLLGNIDSTYDQVGAGASRIEWTVHGVRTDSGKAWKLVRGNRWASDYDISFESGFELLDALYVLGDQRAAPIELRRIDIDVGVRREVRRYEIADVRWSTGGSRFFKARRLRVEPGARIKARVKLGATPSGKGRTVRMGFRAPRRPGGGRIMLSGSGGGEFFDDSDFFCLLFGGCFDMEATAAHHNRDRDLTFEQLLEKLGSEPRNDDVVGTARFKGSRKQQVTRRQGRVVSGAQFLRVRVGGGRR